VIGKFFFLEDYIVNEAPIEDLFTDLNLFYYDMLVEEAFEFFFLLFGNYILHHHSFSDFIFGFYQIDPEWATSRSLFDAVVEEPGGYTGDSNAFYNRDETFFFGSTILIWMKIFYIIYENTMSFMKRNGTILKALWLLVVI